MSLSLTLKKKFDGFSLDVSLSTGEEVLVLFGPSGAGKSLILKMISGLLAPDEGSVVINGVTVFDKGDGINVPIRRRKTGYVFQDYALFPHMTVGENISYGITNIPKDDAAKKVRDILTVMRLSGLEHRYPRELSGGQKQRTALARTLVTGPGILLLDEPFSALDYQVREKLRMDLVNIHGIFPITTVIVTHDLEEAFMLGSRIAVVNNGQIEQMGTREDVFYRPATRNVARFVGTRNIFSGKVNSVEDDTVAILCGGLGAVRALRPQFPVREGQEVTFCIRPEEIPVIRADRALDARVQDNVIVGEVTSTIGRGTTHILFVRIGEAGTELKVEVPNFVLRKLGLAAGRTIRVSLKKESIWIIP